MRNKFKRRGFTLIELLVVVIIIAILSVVVVVSYQKARTTSRDSKRMSDLASVANGIQMFFAKNEFYPQNPVGDEFCKFSDAGCLKGVYATVVPDFISILPSDPQSTGDYYYAGFDATDDSIPIGKATGYAIVKATFENKDAIPTDAYSVAIHCVKADGTYCVKIKLGD